MATGLRLPVWTAWTAAIAVPAAVFTTALTRFGVPLLSNGDPGSGRRGGAR